MSIRCRTRAANGSGLVATNKSHPCTEGVPRRHVPAHAETHAHVQVCEIFSCFLIVFCCSWGGQDRGPACACVYLYMSRDAGGPRSAERTWGERLWRIVWLSSACCGVDGSFGDVFSDDAGSLYAIACFMLRASG